MLVGVAHGAPAVPMATVPCAPSPRSLSAVADDAVVCWDAGCMQIEYNDEVRIVARPSARRAWRDPVGTITDSKACVGSTCKPIGPKLAAALADARQHTTAEQPFSVGVSSDLKVVVIRPSGLFSEAWTLATDRPLVLREPKEDVAGFATKPEIHSIDIAHELLVVHWVGCAGPCTEAQLADTSGRNLGRPVKGGGGAIQINAKQFAVISEFSDLHVFDLVTGKPRGSLALSVASFSGGDAVVLDSGDLALMDTISSGGARISYIDFHDVDHPTVRRVRYLPSCPH